MMKLRSSSNTSIIIPIPRDIWLYDVLFLSNDTGPASCYSLLLRHLGKIMISFLLERRWHIRQVQWWFNSVIESCLIVVLVMVNGRLAPFIIADNMFVGSLVSNLHFKPGPHRGCLFGRHFSFTGQQLRLGKHSWSLYYLLEIHTFMAKFFINVWVVFFFRGLCYLLLLWLRNIFDQYVECSVFDGLQTVSRYSTACLLRCLMQCRFKLSQ